MVCKNRKRKLSAQEPEKKSVIVADIDTSDSAANNHNEDSQKTTEPSEELPTKKEVEKSLAEMERIKIIVEGTLCFGHQRAAITIMQRLRELGFKGVFYIYATQKSKTELITMIPELSEKSTDDNGIKDVPVPVIGEVLFSTSEDGKDNITASLAICPGSDQVSSSTITQDLKVTYYICFHPTDWKDGQRTFFIDSEGICKLFDGSQTEDVRGDFNPHGGQVFFDASYHSSEEVCNCRLSSSISHQIPNAESIERSLIETKVLNILAHDVNSQFIYGIKGHSDCDFFEQIKAQYYVFAQLLMVNSKFSSDNKKPIILFTTRDGLLEERFINGCLRIGCHNFTIIDITKGDIDISEYKAGDVVIVYTGSLQYQVFDYLLLKGTNLPPVIEGCNARELCESTGRPFLCVSSEYNNYGEVYGINQDEEEAIGCDRSALDETNKIVNYMQKVLAKDPNTMKYHENLKKKFLDRPDMVEAALHHIGVRYKEVGEAHDITNTKMESASAKSHENKENLAPGT